MITFFTCIIALIGAYFIYGKYIEKKFGASPTRKTPAYTLTDGVDFLPMKPWRIFLIQFLNIAGLGPIFGAVAGAMWGPVAFLWIVLGTIFAGAVHDYFSGMVSLRHNGASIAEVVGIYLGKGIKNFMRLFTLFLLVIVGAVFVNGPASILQGITGFNFTILVSAIFLYYLLATLLPIDKLIGRIYPVFGLCLLIMALGITITMVTGGLKIPELAPANLVNMHSQPEKFPVFPLMFITIACGAISGFHATQSPMMARCLPNETDGRLAFFGAMVAEGIVALIWAAAGMSFFGGPNELNSAMAQEGQNAAWAVNKISFTLMGKIGGVLSLLGVVAAPITSGDTAFRGARLTIADWFNIKQDKIIKRIYITVPIFIVGYILTKVEFPIIWRYFAWANQTLSIFILWAAAVYMRNNRSPYWFLVLPAMFMTVVVVSYLFIAPESFNLGKTLSYSIGIGCSALFLAIFIFTRPKP